MSKKYQVTLNEEQLRIISACLEDCHRFMSGQVEMANSTAILDNMHEVQEKLREVYPFVVPQLYRQYGYGASYKWNGGNCANMHQKQFIARTYYLYREIRHHLNKSKEEWNVYKSETLICKDSGEPIKIELL